MRPLASLVALLALGTPVAAHAQFATVPAPPPRSVRPTAPEREDSARAPAVARDTVKEIQRLDIQAWVDSAAGALARTPPPSTGGAGSPPPPTRPAPAGAAPAVPAPRDSVARPRPPR